MGNPTPLHEPPERHSTSLQPNTSPYTLGDMMSDKPARNIDTEALFELITEFDEDVRQRFDEIMNRFDLQDAKFEAQVALVLDALVNHGLEVNKRLDILSFRLGHLIRGTRIA